MIEVMELTTENEPEVCTEDSENFFFLIEQKK